MLQWIVEPVVGISQNRIRFIASGNPGDITVVGNIIAIMDSISPLVSRLRITSDSSLPTANVVCLSGRNNETRPYFMDRFSKLYKNKWPCSREIKNTLLFEPITLTKEKISLHA